MTTQIEANYIEGFSNSDIIRAKEAIEILEALVNSQEFKKAVISERRFKRRKIKTKSGNHKYTNTEILNLILSGEDLKNSANNIVNLNLKLYDSKKNEIGNTNTSTLIISTYRGYFINSDIKCYTCHILHEYMHVIGFTHSFFNVFGREYTVPYRIGTIAKKILNCNYN